MTEEVILHICMYQNQESVISQ